METQITIPGLHYRRSFIPSTEADRLIQSIDQQLWMTDLKRRVQHYGYRYDYKARAVNASMALGPLPEWLTELAKRLHAERIMPQCADQVIINEYQPGQGISSHIDCEPCFGNVVVSLTLGSGCEMAFTQAQGTQKLSIYLEPCSLLWFHDEARYKWKHGILPRKSDVVDGRTVERGRRLSLTFRTVTL